MSISQTRHWISQALDEIKKDPVFYFVAGVVQILLIWSQDVLPFIGTFLASVFSMWLIGRVFTKNWRTRSKWLAVLGLIHFPVTAFWPILVSFYQNSGWLEIFSLAWLIPILFFLSLGELTFAGAAANLLAEKNLDQSLLAAWKKIAKEWQSVFALCLLMVVLFILSFLTMGAGFFIAAPFQLALIKVLFKE